jgi:hypothetical protein
MKQVSLCMKSLRGDEKGTATVLEYMLLISLAATITLIAIVLFNGLLADAAQQSITTQYTSLGNQLASTINEMQLANCTNASRTFKIPYHIGSEESVHKGYSIDANTTDYFGRPALKIYSADVTVYVPLNVQGRGNSTLSVTGHASSIATTRVRITKCENVITLANV